MKEHPFNLLPRVGVSVMWGVLFLLLIGTAGTEAADELRSDAEIRGVTHSRPAEGRFVQVDANTWMVPYREVLIPDVVEFEMVPIPGGHAIIGSPDTDLGGRADEKPQFQVSVAPYWMARTETTWEVYREFQKSYSEFRNQMLEQGAGDIRIENVDAVTAPTPLYDTTYIEEFGDTDQPAITMTQFAARQFSKWLSLRTSRQYRLPTEIEWEYACRAGTATAYSCGDDPSQLPLYAIFGRTSESTILGTDRVASRQPNPWGLYDMHGNVAEWVIDHYAADGYLELARQLKQRTGTTVLPAHRLDHLWGHVLRGGSWEDPAAHLRSAARRSSSTELIELDPSLPTSPYWLASDSARTVGFRLVRSFTPESPDVIARFWNPDSQELDAALKDYFQSNRGVVGVPQPLTEKRN